MTYFNLKKTLKNFGHFLIRAGNDPYFDWASILVLSFAVAAVFIGFGTKLFFQVSGDAAGSAQTPAATSASPGSPLPDTADLNTLVSIFQSKNAQGPVYAFSYPGPSDPAVPIEAVKISNPSVAPVPKVLTKVPAKTAAKAPSK